MKAKKRTVAALLHVKKAGEKKKRQKNALGFPKHIYIHCRSRAIAMHFLKDAEAEGFLFSDGIKPTEKEPDDIYALNSDFTISYTGMFPHMMFGGGGDNVIWIDYGNYISGAKDFQTVKRRMWGCGAALTK